MTHDEKNNQNDPDMIEMTEFVNMGFKTAVLTIFCMFQKADETLSY